jgi:hypothetical protein
MRLIWFVVLALVFWFLLVALGQFRDLKTLEVSLKEKEVSLKTKELMLLDRLATCPQGKVAGTRSGYECFGSVMKLEN